jgi:hypothetical protein
MSKKKKRIREDYKAMLDFYTSSKTVKNAVTIWIVQGITIFFSPFHNLSF